MVKIIILLIKDAKNKFQILPKMKIFTIYKD